MSKLKLVQMSEGLPLGSVILVTGDQFGVVAGNSVPNAEGRVAKRTFFMFTKDIKKPMITSVVSDDLAEVAIRDNWFALTDLRAEILIQPGSRVTPLRSGLKGASPLVLTKRGAVLCSLYHSQVNSQGERAPVTLSVCLPLETEVAVEMDLLGTMIGIDDWAVGLFPPDGSREPPKVFRWMNGDYGRAEM